MKQVLSILGKLKGRSWNELRVRGHQQFAMWAERYRWSTLSRLPGEGEFSQLLDPAKIGDGGAAAVPSPAALLEHFRARQTPHFFPAFNQKAGTIATLRERFGGPALATLLKRAQKLVDGEFDLLGYNGLSFGEPIDWQLEPVGGKKAPLVHWSQIGYLDPDTAGDKKITWELNRHQYFATLGRAYWHTGDERYAQVFISHLSAWMDCNPPKLGINWTSSLEVSFRVISWLWALHFFRQSTHLTPQFLWRVLKFIYLHARHLETYLSTYFSPNTHITGEALGLFYLGTLLPEFKSARRWRQVGHTILRAELERHVKPDGVYFEQASYYHRYTADFYIHFYLLAQGNGMRVEEVFREKLIALLDHLLHITKPDGTTPLFGDDDGGRLVLLDERPLNDFRSTLAAGAAIFSRPDYKFVAEDASEEILWLLGGDGLRSFDQLDARPPIENSRAFPDGGYYVMRDGWSRAANYLLIDCGPHGGLNCGHAHADALSFELAARGRTLLIDPGTYTYTGSPQMRNHFRSSAAHNTLTIDGVSSSLPGGPFAWKRIARTSVKEWQSGQRFDFLEAAHDGYSSLDAPAVHTRSVLFIKGDYWIVKDKVATQGAHRYDLNFHFAVGSAPTIESDAGVAAMVSERSVAGGLDLCTFGEKGAWRQEEAPVSRFYGDLSVAPALTFSTQTKGAAEFVTFLFPRASDDMRLRVQEIGGAAGRAFKVAGGDGTDFLLIGPGASERIESDCAWTWTRFSADGTGALQEVVLLGGGCLRLDGRRIFEMPDSAGYLTAQRVRQEEWQVETSGAGSLSVAMLGAHAVVLNGEKFPAAGRETLRFVAGRLQEEYGAAADDLAEMKR